ncbi:hypothetical protein M3J09_011513 [Ascochyta lentis]
MLRADHHTIHPLPSMPFKFPTTFCHRGTSQKNNSVLQPTGPDNFGAKTRDAAFFTSACQPRCRKHAALPSVVPRAQALLLGAMINRATCCFPHPLNRHFDREACVKVARVLCLHDHRRFDASCLDSEDRREIPILCSWLWAHKWFDCCAFCSASERIQTVASKVPCMQLTKERAFESCPGPSSRI